VIRIDALWLCTKPVDMCCGAERLPAHVVHALGSANAHHSYVFANVRATRIKMLVHDSFGVWCAARRLNVERFVCPCEIDASKPIALPQAQFDVLVIGLPLAAPARDQRDRAPVEAGACPLARPDDVDSASPSGSVSGRSS
jgi:hypothetical protein